MRVEKCSFLIDGGTLVSVGEDQIIVWDVKEQKQLRCMKLQSYSYNVAYSSNAKLLALNLQNEIRILDLTVGKEVTVFEGQSKLILCMVFQPDTQILVSINWSDNQIKLWDTQTEKSKNQSEGNLNLVGYVAFSPDSKKLASQDSKGTYIWDSYDGKQIMKLDKNDIGGNLLRARIEFSQNGQCLFSNDFEKFLIWHYKDDKQIQIYYSLINQKYVTTQISIQPYGDILAWGIETKTKTYIINLWNVKEQSMKQLQSHKKHTVPCLFFCGNGQLFVLTQLNSPVSLQNW